jgi:signal transduction histidine kinase
MIVNDRLRPQLLIAVDGTEPNPLVAQLIHKPFPKLANVLRAMADRITIAWDLAVRRAMPQMKRLTFDELKDSTPAILLAIADALASDDPELISDLIKCAPRQGLSRLKLNLDVVEVMQEDRLLRAIIVTHVESGLRRRLKTPEAAALHADIDLMLQRSVIAMVEEQKIVLRAAAETELKFLSFLAHDMNNNLNNVNLQLSVLAVDLQETGASTEAQESLRLSQKSIEDTVHGMRAMLDHERMRKSDRRRAETAIDLYELAKVVAWQFANAAALKGVKIFVEVPRGTVVQSDGELITVVLQNLVGNAVKYSSRGSIRVGGDFKGHVGNEMNSYRQSIWVSDDGEGIKPEKLSDIFEAFRRGEIHGQWGVGLGLAIASQGAKLLNAELTVDSTPGIGSIFRLIFPRANESVTNDHRAVVGG